jgi:hypothetical protein
MSAPTPSLPSPSSAGAGSQAPRNVPALLNLLHADGFTGAVTVSGAPGGTLHLRAGLVVAVQTPAAPTVETLLLKSHRVTEQDWTTARDTARGEGGMAASLSARTAVSRMQLELVCTAAVFDAAFAMSLTAPEGWHLVEAAQPPELTAEQGAEPARLTEETVRRTAVLAEHWQPLSRLTAARIRPSAAHRPGTLAERHRDILLAANGRRSPRDIAFALGRGLYPVMLDLTRMRARGLIDCEAPTLPRPVPSVAPRRAAAIPAPRDDVDSTSAPLPRRNTGSAKTPAAPAGDAGTDRMSPHGSQAFARLRRRRGGDHTGDSEAR